MCQRATAGSGATVGADTRCRAAAALARAMSGQKASALGLLNVPREDTRASAALGMAEALILYLDGDTAEALKRTTNLLSGTEANAKFREAVDGWVAELSECRVQRCSSMAAWWLAMSWADIDPPW